MFNVFILSAAELLKMFIIAKKKRINLNTFNLIIIANFLQYFQVKVYYIK